MYSLDHLELRARVPPFETLLRAESLIEIGIWGPRDGGGGVLSLEKGTNCGLTALEMWLSRANRTEKGGCPFIINSHRKLPNLFIFVFYTK